MSPDTADSRCDLEYQFNPRVAVPDFTDIQEIRKRRSRQVLESTPDITCTQTSSSRPVDIVYVDDSRRPAPLLIFLHGGYWRAGAAADNAFIIPALRRTGIQPVLMGYPLCPSVSLPELIDTVIENAAWVIDNAGSIGAADGPVMVGGVSAGAHLAAELLRASGHAFDRINGALLLTGIYDLSPVSLISVNAEIGLSPTDAERCSPMFGSRPRAVNMVLANGSEEPALWRSQTRVYVELCRACGSNVISCELQDRNHFNLIDALDEERSELVAALKAMQRAVSN